MSEDSDVCKLEILLNSGLNMFKQHIYEYTILLKKIKGAFSSKTH